MKVKYAAVFAGLMMAFGNAGASSAWPERPVRIVVPFAAGGANDLVARLYASKFSQELGQSFVVENRAGASGAIAAAHVANTPADGYTLLLGANAVIVVNPILRPDVGYNGDDFTAIGIAAQAPCILVVTPSLEVDDVKGLVNYAQENRGKVNYASPGQGTQMHLLGELFKLETGLELTHVPYKGSVPALTDVIGGEVQMMFDNAQSSLPQVQADKLKALAVTGQERLSALPNVPTMAEAGFPSVNAVSWFSIMARDGIPAEAKRKLQSAMAKIAQDPDTAERLATFGAQPSPVPPAEAGEFIEGERQKWTKVIKEAGIKAL